MGIQHNESVPASFLVAGQQGYLGDPEVVSSEVARFLASAEELVGHLRNGDLSKDDFAAASRQLVQGCADVFAGRAEGYVPIQGYTGQTLGYKVMADLPGGFWAKRRAAWGDDPMCVLFEYLLLRLVEDYKTADGDDMLLGVMLGPTVEGVTRLLLGTERTG